jgi:hypothetical protein
MRMNVDSYIIDAVEMCKRYDFISPALLQRTLAIDYYQALEIFQQLKEMGILQNEVIKVENEDEPICEVNQEELKQLSLN